AGDLPLAAARRERLDEDLVRTGLGRIEGEIPSVRRERRGVFGQLGAGGERSGVPARRIEESNVEAPFIVPDDHAAVGEPGIGVEEPVAAEASLTAASGGSGRRQTALPRPAEGIGKAAAVRAPQRGAAAPLEGEPPQLSSRQLVDEDVVVGGGPAADAESGADPPPR